MPWGGHRDPVAHNIGDNQSEFTSWTTERRTAESFATDNPGAVILEQSVKRKELVWSPGNFLEDEVLRYGPTEGAKVVML